PEATDNSDRLRTQLLELKQLFDRMAEKYPQMDTLSMGMSNDLELAVACGSTLVRVGTAIFGSRNP
ncbi:MAG: alanine racemase, partial [Oceanisphaera sp.]|nr:alanine racemase [Oceanisphaera sp.]